MSEKMFRFQASEIRKKAVEIGNNLVDITDKKSPREIDT